MCLPRLGAAAHRLGECGVPDTLVHGDFLPGNVALAARGPVFLDWCEASVSHPFFSAVRFLESSWWDSRPVREQPDVVARLRAAYLEPWARYGPRATLVEAITLAAALQPLHHALTYRHLWHLLAADTPGACGWERRTVAARSAKRPLTRWEELEPG